MSDPGFFGPAVLPPLPAAPPVGAPAGWAPPAPTGPVLPPPPAAVGGGTRLKQVGIAVGVLAVVAAALLLGRALTTATAPAAPLAGVPLQVGECVAVLPVAGQSPQRVGCALPHVAEVFAVVPVAQAQGISGAAAQLAACTDQTGEFLLGDTPAGVSVVALQPGEPGRLVCVLTSGGAPSTGSLRGTGGDGS